MWCVIIFLLRLGSASFIWLLLLYTYRFSHYDWYTLRRVLLHLDHVRLRRVGHCSWGYNLKWLWNTSLSLRNSQSLFYLLRLLLIKQCAFGNVCGFLDPNRLHLRVLWLCLKNRVIRVLLLCVFIVNHHRHLPFHGIHD